MTHFEKRRPRKLYKQLCFAFLALLVTGICFQNCSGFSTSGAGSVGDDSAGSQNPPKSLSVSQAYGCALYQDETVKCWGTNQNLQLGTGAAGSSFSYTPIPVAGVTGAIQLSTGLSAACAVLATGAVECWGGGSVFADSTISQSATPVSISGITNAVSVSVGNVSACAVLGTGGIACWGDGSGPPGLSVTPAPVQGITNAVAISVSWDDSSGDFACALMKDGSVACWGSDAYGQLGDGGTSASSAPLTVPGVSNATAIAVLEEGAACALVSSGSVYCWGRSQYGQLGNTSNSGSGAAAVSGISTATSLNNGSGLGACAILASGAVSCWGPMANVQAGLNSSGFNTDSTTPIVVSNLVASAVSIGHGQFCALVGTQVQCWGDNQQGECGANANSNSAAPMSIPGVTAATGIAATDFATCIQLSGGSVQCWGYISQTGGGASYFTDTNLLNCTLQGTQVTCPNGYQPSLPSEPVGAFSQSTGPSGANNCTVTNGLVECTGLINSYIASPTTVIGI